jgi:hypothetical protein
MRKMRTPNTRAEFERAIYLLTEQVRQGRMHFPAGAKSIASLLAIRSLPNGRVDFLSVDEFARLHANMAVQLEDEMMGELTKLRKPRPPQDSVDTPESSG